MRRRTSGTGPEACSCGAVAGRQGLGDLLHAVFAAGHLARVSAVDRRRGRDGAFRHLPAGRPG